MDFRTLFTLRPVHPYFSTGIGPGYRFVPTDRTQKQMRRNSQRLRSDEQYCEVLQDFDKLGQLETQGSCFFDIALYPEDDLFLIYSKLDIDFKTGQIYLLGNRSGTIGTTKKPQPGLALINRADGTGYRSVPVLLTRKTFSLSPRIDQGDTLTLKDNKNQVLREWKVDDSASGQGFYADATRWPDGLFTLYNSQDAVENYYADEQLCAAAPSLVLSIFVDFNHLKKEETKPLFEYEIRFPNRAVYWRYRVVVKNNHRLPENLQIKNGDRKNLPGISFDIEKGGGIDQTEVRFISSAPIPLVDRAYKNISLMDKTREGQALVTHLPNPGVSSVRFKDNRWTADMFIYI